MTLGEYDISSPYEATLIATERITSGNSDAEVRHLVLSLPEDDFNFVEGQSIGVLVPGPHEFGNPYHLRLYSIASTRSGALHGEADAGQTIDICVRRCFYIDEVSGESYPGVASNFLCDARPGDRILVTGPYTAHFHLPIDDSSNILMVGAGTGIAPFRAFVRHIFEDRRGWNGKVRLYYGARSGTELLYMNDKKNDFTNYYDNKTFQAFEAVSPRPYFDEPPAIEELLRRHRGEIWEMIQDPRTYVYVAGLHQSAEQFEKAMSAFAGSEEAWQAKKQELIEQGRYAELLY
jgi:ferredoxin--NADP+ reductase